jgi:ankyrin repeat protein
MESFDEPRKLNPQRLDYGTPLHISSEQGRVGMVNWWLEFGRIDPNVQNEQLKTPLHLAAKNCHREVVKILLEHGADADATDVSCVPCLRCNHRCANPLASNLRPSSVRRCTTHYD